MYLIDFENFLQYKTFFYDTMSRIIEHPLLEL